MRLRLSKNSKFLALGLGFLLLNVFVTVPSSLAQDFFGFFEDGPIYRAPVTATIKPSDLSKSSTQAMVNPPSRELVSYLESHGIPFPGCSGYEDEVFLTWFEETGNGSGLGTISLKIDPKDFAIVGLVQRFKKESYHEKVLQTPLFSTSDVAQGIVLNRVPIAGNVVTMKAEKVGATPVENLSDRVMKKWNVDKPVRLRFRTKADSLSSSSWKEHEFVVSFVRSPNPEIRSTWELTSGETGEPIKRIVLHSWRSLVRGGVSNVEFKSKDFDSAKKVAFQVRPPLNATGDNTPLSTLQVCRKNP